MYMFLPFYSIYYIITRWSEIKKPFLISLLGAIVMVGGMVPGLLQLKGEVQSVITEFMEAGATKDVSAAYDYCSSQALTKEEISDFINNNFDLFSGFKDVSINSWSLESSAGITRGYASGAIVYKGDTRLPFEAGLIKEKGIWKLVGISIGY